MGQLAMAEESNISFMQMMGKSLLDVDEIESLTEIFDKIQKVTSKNLQDVANEVFDIDQFSFLTYIPE
jgi:predicted Zn-dependent peptidase